MAKKITELVELTSYATNDLLIIEDVSTNTTKKITWANLIADNSITATKVDGIDKSLLTVDSNPYKFSVYRNAAANTGNNAYAKVTFDTEEFDTNNNFATGTYTAPVTGFYCFGWMVTVNITTGSTDTLASLYKNGSIVKRGNEVEGQGGTGGGALISATAGDTFDVYCYGSTTSALVVGTAENTFFHGFLMSRT